MRKIWWGDAWRETPTWPRAKIGADTVDGPLVVDEAYSALWIGPGWRLRALASGDLMAEREGSDPS
jgi:N-methylhydantoinase A/oxoprolinase/acetone carboxylase beta subunit